MYILRNQIQLGKILFGEIGMRLGWFVKKIYIPDQSILT